jgi:phage tail-like protein
MTVSDFASLATGSLPQAASAPVLSTAVSAGRSLISGVSEFTRIGLAMRFQVTVIGLGLPLGDWSSCEGLKVDFKYESVRAGGNYASTHVLPLTVSYTPVTLKRAVIKPYSDSVQKWLQTMAAQWQTAQGEFDAGTAVRIDLYDVYQDEPVGTWSLQKAFPSSWSGPSMNAKSGEVAMETLVIEHDGFLSELA